jgi:hypothetical protein
MSMKDARLESRAPSQEGVPEHPVRVILMVLLLVMAPTAGFFLWAWAVKIKQERKLAGTLPAWQDMPITWLAIAGLVCTIAGFIVLFFTQNQGYGGLFAP